LVGGVLFVERVDDLIQIEEVLIAARASAAESETRKREGGGFKERYAVDRVQCFGVDAA
jgi:hypothetical protein